MSAGADWPWLPRTLYRLTFLTASLLAALVFLSPVLNNKGPPPLGWRRLVAVFAQDSTLRRTALGSAAGLFATASVFFRTNAQEEQRP